MVTKIVVVDIVLHQLSHMAAADTALRQLPVDTAQLQAVTAAADTAVLQLLTEEVNR